MSLTLSQLPVELLAKISAHLKFSELVLGLLRTGDRLLCYKLRNGGVHELFMTVGDVWMPKFVNLSDWKLHRFSLTSGEWHPHQYLVSIIEALPSTLKSIKIEDPYAWKLWVQKIPKNSPFSLSEGVLRADDYVVRDLNRRFPNLTDLEVMSFLSSSELLWPEKFKFQILASLPPSLTRLSASLLQRTKPLWDSQLPRGLLYVEPSISSLPKKSILVRAPTFFYSLISLKLSLSQYFNFVPPSSGSGDSENDDFVVFPPHLTSLDIAMSNYEQKDICTLLPGLFCLTNLKLSLDANKNDFEMEWLFRTLPATLTSLSLEGIILSSSAIKNNKTHSDQESLIAALPLPNNAHDFSPSFRPDAISFLPPPLMGLEVLEIRCYEQRCFFLASRFGTYLTYLLLFMVPRLRTAILPKVVLEPKMLRMMCPQRLTTLQARFSSENFSSYPHELSSHNGRIILPIEPTVPSLVSSAESIPASDDEPEKIEVKNEISYLAALLPNLEDLQIILDESQSKSSFSFGSVPPKVTRLSISGRFLSNETLHLLPKSVTHLVASFSTITYPSDHSDSFCKNMFKEHRNEQKISNLLSISNDPISGLSTSTNAIKDVCDIESSKSADVSVWHSANLTTLFSVYMSVDGPAIVPLHLNLPSKPSFAPFQFHSCPPLPKTLTKLHLGEASHSEALIAAFTPTALPNLLKVRLYGVQGPLKDVNWENFEKIVSFHATTHQWPLALPPNLRSLKHVDASYVKAKPHKSTSGDGILDFFPVVASSIANRDLGPRFQHHMPTTIQKIDLCCPCAFSLDEKDFPNLRSLVLRNSIVGPLIYENPAPWRVLSRNLTRLNMLLTNTEGNNLNPLFLRFPLLRHLDISGSIIDDRTLYDIRDNAPKDFRLRGGTVTLIHEPPRDIVGIAEGSLSISKLVKCSFTALFPFWKSKKPFHADKLKILFNLESWSFYVRSLESLQVTSIDLEFIDMSAACTLVMPSTVTEIVASKFLASLHDLVEALPRNLLSLTIPAHVATVKLIQKLPPGLTRLKFTGPLSSGFRHALRSLPPSLTYLSLPQLPSPPSCLKLLPSSLKELRFKKGMLSVYRVFTCLPETLKVISGSIRTKKNAQYSDSELSFLLKLLLERKVQFPRERFLQDFANRLLSSNDKIE